MLTLDAAALARTEEWERAGVTLPCYDIAAMRGRTADRPIWLHFGAGNIFRGFIARLQHRLLQQGLAERGIIAADTFDHQLIREIYHRHDDLTLIADLGADGEIGLEVAAGVAESICADGSAESLARLREIFAAPSLQMVSFTITEKGYELRGISGELLPTVAHDLCHAPAKAQHAMSILCALLYHRWQSGAQPLALVSMDNCSRNGERLQGSITEVARAWADAGFIDGGFLDYISDSSRVSFPWSMIDKITPRPATAIQEALEGSGIGGMAPITTDRGTYIAPFVNAEIPQYLVIEDLFPNGRPPLEAAGVYLTDRDTVNRTERMKVCTCLNPLHTALAVYGCLLGYESIAAEMADPQLSALVRRIGYAEGMPVVTDPGIISPDAFLSEVLQQRLPNAFIPDTPQRIACDCSQKIPIRFGETIKAYVASPELDVLSLCGIPLAIAGWLRYLLGVNDRLEPMPISPDPLLGQLQSQLEGIRVGEPDSCGRGLEAILSSAKLFGTDLCACGLSERIEAMLREMLRGAGAVRATLAHRLAE